MPFSTPPSLALTAHASTHVDLGSDEITSPLDSGAIKAVKIYGVSDTLLISNDTERAVDAASYGKEKETLLGHILGSLRTKFDLVAGVGGTTYGKLYKGGTAVGTERSTTSTTYVTFSEDINWGTTVNTYAQVYGYRAVAIGNIRNFRFYADPSPDYTNSTGL